jgi:hypothetical protein
LKRREPHRSRPRSLPTVLGLAFLLLAGAATADPEPPAEARFTLERITVVGTAEAAARIVLAESLLKEGQTYTEEGLRKAIYRIERLPFVVEADFSLGKGSRRGAYELLISARPAKRLFFDHALDYATYDRGLNLDPAGSHEVRSSGLAGVRFFVGPTGVLFAALDSQEGAQAGYTRYGLFGRGGVATATYSWLDCCSREILPHGLDPSFAVWTWGGSGRASVDLAVPLAGDHSLRFSWSERRGDPGNRRGIFDRPRPDDGFLLDRGTLVSSRAAAKWAFDSSDDPFAPSRGTTASAGLEAYWFRARRLERVTEDTVGAPLGAAIRLPELDGREVALVAEVAHHLPITFRQTISLTGRASAGRSRVDHLDSFEPVPARARFTTWGASVGARHSLRLWQARADRGFGDLRLETSAELGREWVAPGLRFANSPLSRVQLSTALVFRNAWGHLRAGFTALRFGQARER